MSPLASAIGNIIRTASPELDDLTNTFARVVSLQWQKATLLKATLVKASESLRMPFRLARNIDDS